MIDVQHSDELKAVILAMRRVDAPLRKAIYAASREKVNALWVPELSRRARTAAARLVIVKGARAAIRQDGFSLMAATSKRKLKGGLVPADEWAGFEFGARTRKATFQARSPKGRSFERTTTVNRQFKGRQRQGQIAFDAASEVGTKTVAAWVVAVVTTIVHASKGEAS